MLGSIQQEHTEYKVVIAYDFGTTYSGAAYAFTHTSPEVFDIQNWPLKEGNYFPKVPTLSVYPRHNRPQPLYSLRRTALSEWGYGAKKTLLKPHADKQNILLSQFKLQLDESLQHPPLENGLAPVQVVADYLAALHRHTLKELRYKFASNYHPDTFRYCLTVPALWSDKAKHMMRQAAIQAGIVSPSDPSDRLVLISEPEAAALYCEETMADQVQLKDNDRFMVCDAGGGTVDIIVYQVNFTQRPRENRNCDSKNLMIWKKHRLKEVTKGIGESCGSVFLDECYRELLQTKLGEQVIRKIYLREMHDMMDQFIVNIKPEFNGKDAHYVRLPRSVDLNDLPANLRDEDEDGNLDQGIVKFSAQELTEKVFDPVVNKILSLIVQQYRQIPDGRLNFLFLVGGFGSSKYLYERIRYIFQKANVQVICPAERSALAVVRGATYYGLNPRMVVSRVSRRTYGICVVMEYDEENDIPAKRKVDGDGSIMCRDRFSPFIKKNDILPVDCCIERKFHISYGTQDSANLDLYAIDSDVIPRYYDAPGVYRVAKLTVPVPVVPGMGMYEHLHHDIRMYFGTTEIRMEADFGTGQAYNIYCDFDAVDNYDS
ncbi:hypothetical protein BDA99DRAFT_602584 [Phascolomyces articulosus]|uniref:Actin-like ATPase domain-containing protein n=1 Tax=Phascolomyces articulosus TaxID=60185 RepID=A0AAD5K6X9_9FUNG|nr:hypothetical protein BDA99DRAFT_602584 [Phascolomyces articulosus]